jgi:hypothetical protein
MRNDNVMDGFVCGERPLVAAAGLGRNALPLRLFGLMPYCWLRHIHPSKTERDDCNHLIARMKAGEIRRFRPYPSIKLHVNGKVWKTWKADFEVEELDGTISIHESKGWNRSNDEFRLKASHFLLEYPHIPLYVNRVRVYPGDKRFIIPGVRSRKRKRCLLVGSWNADGLKLRRVREKRYYKTWDITLKRWVTKKLEDK